MEMLGQMDEKWMKNGSGVGMFWDGRVGLCCICITSRKEKSGAGSRQNDEVHL